MAIPAVPAVWTVALDEGPELFADKAGLSAVGGRPPASNASDNDSGVEPQCYGIGPVEAVDVALKRARIPCVSSVELDEVFSARSPACLAKWPALDPALVNPSGGPIAIGHPLGCSGARLLATLAWRLYRTGSRCGLAAMCGLGQGITVILEETGGKSI